MKNTRLPVSVLNVDKFDVDVQLRPLLLSPFEFGSRELTN